MRTSLSLLLLSAFLCLSTALRAEPLKIALFEVDATPPVGSRLAYDEMIGYTLPLSCRGMVLMGDGKPVVLCAVDWIGIANGGQDEFKAGLAKAAGTTPDRVAVHALHQHDAPICDFTADALLAEHGHGGTLFNVDFARSVIANAAKAIEASMQSPMEVTHLGMGAGNVEKVASNRRILGPDGKVRAMRFTSCRDPNLRAEPPGTIDPAVRLISFWNGEEPLAFLSYYATHPQSYYRTGLANPDFPGMARVLREAQVDDKMHVHFTGAGGNIGAGKWNDGSRRNRVILAQRLAEGIEEAWETTEKQAVTAEDLEWQTVPVKLPVGGHLIEDDLRAQLENGGEGTILGTAMRLAWVSRRAEDRAIDIACLSLGDARVLHMPGELFVEYQIAAQAMRPDLLVATAAYGEYGPGYIGTTVAYPQGGYETSDGASFVDPSAEEILLEAMVKLLEPEDENLVAPSDFTQR